nr:unnamed protein product [Callosobruchus analis]
MKYAEEIQAFHFGGARQQITLHTVVVYTKYESETVPESYCTLSESLNHGPAAIWAHLRPILTNYTQNGINTIHFLSDSPATQYRNKEMFCFNTNHFKKHFPEVKELSWNYLEAGHGKGAPDGIGGVCKRTADRVVSQGKNIFNLETLVNVLKECCPGISFYVISATDIEKFTSIISKQSSLAFKGTLKVHQVLPVKNKLYLRTNTFFRYLASGNTFTDIHYTYRLGISTISSIVEAVCDEVWKIMKNECMPDPTEEKWREIAINFEKYANFPNCIGAVDGKHIRIVKPINSGSLCYNYKSFFSIVLLAVCDANFCFTYIDVGAFGKFSDSNVFVNSEFWNKLENDLLHIPKERPISGDEEMRSFPYVLVGDEAFKLTPHLMRPYARKNLNHKKKIFNYRLTRARRYIECSFGILSNKWRIFHRPLNVSFRLAKKIIKACCVLHNFVCSRDGYAFHHTLKTKGFRPINPAISVQNRVGYSVRDQFANYFVSPSGQVPWQESRI